MVKEAQGEGERGMLAVGFVTLNRRDGEKFPTTVRKVVYQKSQFSWVDYGTNFGVTDEEVWLKAKKLSKFLLALAEHPSVYVAYDITGGATHFHTTSVRPYWRKAYKKTVKIGRHIFYKEVVDG